LVETRMVDMRIVSTYYLSLKLSFSELTIVKIVFYDFKLPYCAKDCS
jgi:hypothetical protein